MPSVITQYKRHMLVLTTLFCMLLAQLNLGITCVHLVQRLAMSVAVMHNTDYSGLMQALQCMQQRKQ